MISKYETELPAIFSRLSEAERSAFLEEVETNGEVTAWTDFLRNKPDAFSTITPRGLGDVDDAVWQRYFQENFTKYYAR